MIRLYSYWRSSSAWRVRLALALKGIVHELTTVNLLPSRGEQHTEAFRAMSPLSQVPVLEVREGEQVLRLTQSLAIIEYLEERFPERPLLPRDAEGRARARELAEIVNSGIQPHQNLALRLALDAAGADGAAYRAGMIDRGLAAMEAIAEQTAGRFLVRDGVTYADIYLVPQLDAARRFDVDLERFPTLRRVEAECCTLVEFQSAHPNAQPDRETQP
jgi:maleylpyruvate isomerase